MSEFPDALVMSIDTASGKGQAAYVIMKAYDGTLEVLDIHYSAENAYINFWKRLTNYAQ